MTTQSSEPPIDTSRHYAFNCGICGTRFVRREHLSRHIRSHTREKPFHCRTCRKAFTRADILQRHERSHTYDGTVKTAKSGSSFRACIACASGRVRCSGQTPCNNCEKKGIECRYPMASVPRSSSVQSTGYTQDPAVLTGSQNATHGDGESNEQQISDAQGEDIGSGPMHGASNLQVQETALSAQLTTGSQEQQWDATWSTSGNSYLSDFQQFPNVGAQYLPQSGYQDGLSFEIHDSINWMSPSTSVWRDWDFRFAALADPSVPIFFTPLVGAQIQGNLNVDLAPQQPSSWNPESQMTFPPTANATGNVTSPGVLSTTRSVHSLRSEGGSTSVVSGSDDLRRTSPRLYVDSVGARGTLQKPRRKRTRSSFEMETFQDPRVNLSMQPQTHSPGDEDTLPSNPWISSELYQDIARNSERPASESPIGAGSSHLPSLGLLNIFCQLYFDDFHPEFPFLNMTPNQWKDQGWILAVAVATIGAQYSNSYATDHQKLLEAILREALDTLVSGRGHPDVVSAASPCPEPPSVESLVVLQARILNIIIATRSGEAVSTSKALTDFKSLVAAAKRANLLRPLPRSASNTFHGTEIELRARTGCMIFMLDYILSYEFNEPPLLDIADAQIPLSMSMEMSLGDPTRCDETGMSCTLTDALELLFTEKRLLPGLSEFGRILLAQAVCRQTMEMRRHLRNRMSHWIPTAIRQSEIRFSDPDLWPPSSTTFSKWRNSACDGLDVLHWSANSKIAQSKGFEHPTVLHLHLARLIILTPHEEIRRFAESYLSSAPKPIAFDQYNNPAPYTVLQWAIRDQYKARLTLIHAAAIFWHIRRYSCDSFIEPFATYLSTLVIWAYSITTRLAATHEVQIPPQEPPQITTTSESESELDLEFINIDRPCDDESIQMFVRHGHRLTANMVRVGDICSEGAPRKILLEGIRLLSGRKSGDGGANEEDTYTWKSTKGYVASLEALVKVIK